MLLESILQLWLDKTWALVRGGDWFVDLINIDDLNYLAKNKVKDKRQDSYKWKISNLQITACVFGQPGFGSFLSINIRNCMGVLVTFPLISWQRWQKKLACPSLVAWGWHLILWWVSDSWWEAAVINTSRGKNSEFYDLHKDWLHKSMQGHSEQDCLWTGP